MCAFHCHTICTSKEPPNQLYLLLLFLSLFLFIVLNIFYIVLYLFCRRRPAEHNTITTVTSRPVVAVHIKSRPR